VCICLPFGSWLDPEARAELGDARVLPERDEVQPGHAGERHGVRGELVSELEALRLLIRGRLHARDHRVRHLDAGHVLIHVAQRARVVHQRVDPEAAQVMRGRVRIVDRDDLGDGGAGIFARTIRAIRRRSPGTTIEVLTPDFQGDFDPVRIVVEAGPDIFNHNTETVPRLYTRIRPKAIYANSLALLHHVKTLAPSMVTKSGVMVGLGETEEELLEVFSHMRAHDIDVLTVGQYLRPSKKHAEVVRYYAPEEFARLKVQALEMGFGHVEAGPLVRSSYHADEQVPVRKSLLAG